MSNDNVYEKNLIFFILVCLSAIGSALNILSTVWATIGFFCLDYIFVALYSAFILAWDITILKNQDFFDTGDLKKKCMPFLVASAACLVRAAVGFVVTSSLIPMSSFGFIGMAVFSGLFWYCFQKVSFFRPYKLAQTMPVYMQQNATSPYKN